MMVLGALCQIKPKLTCNLCHVNNIHVTWGSPPHSFFHLLSLLLLYSKKRIKDQPPSKLLFYLQVGDDN
ncbi:hypothetical protein GLYMA_01G045000v4 [Glycine max]|uniref:Uncharacterized protein n=2 Tax=Glycine subgen. Soja TaxID=1462606 RepID=A0A0R0LD95_SOYBN|nr:hypothetical protein JHK87_000439 [Glycine soja]KAG5068065.1 hypothetical protein JHK85_000442 [Glycine max]KAG5087823.1 hypothetical protein JHK86_000435 [Glycine max]KAH1161593.1 hypothetical protein GYH30_000470 [Glycine max]KRH74827.1 hypothetical protein GLYMA_01G045000v4 [Glycine max]